MRQAVAGALGQLGAAATPEVVTALLHALADPDAAVRWAAAWALEQLGAGAATPEVVNALLQALANPDATCARRLPGHWDSWEREWQPQRACLPYSRPWPIRTPDVRRSGSLGAGAAGSGGGDAGGSDDLAPGPGRSGRRRVRVRRKCVERLSGYVRLPDRSAMVKLLLPLARSSEVKYRDVGYVSLRNLLATEPVSDMSHALAGLSE